MENLLKRIKSRISALYNSLYDRYYLIACMNSVDETKDTLVVGSSYAIFAFNPSPNQICMGLPSQDIYYSDVIIRNIISKPHNNIKKIVLVVGYYTMWYDLSMVKSQSFRISDVYLPLFGNPHYFNAPEFKGTREKLLHGFDIVSEAIMRCICFAKPIDFYFGRKCHSRYKRRLITWDDDTLAWAELDENVQKNASIKRMKSHGKMFKYENTLLENEAIIKNLYSALNSSGIKLYTVVAPFSKAYIDAMSENFKMHSAQIKTFWQKYSDVYADFNVLSNVSADENFEFNDDDFVDADHLSDAGACKFMKLLNNILEEVVE